MLLPVVDPDLLFSASNQCHTVGQATARLSPRYALLLEEAQRPWHTESLERDKILRNAAEWTLAEFAEFAEWVERRIYYEFYAESGSGNFKFTMFYKHPRRTPQERQD